MRLELRRILFPLIILEMFLKLDWSRPVVNSIDWTWFGKAHTCLCKIPQLTVHARAKTKPWALRQLCLYGRGPFLRERYMTARFEFAKRHLKTPRPWETRFSGLMKPKLNSLTWMPNVPIGETWNYPYGEAWWWQNHAVGMFFSGRDWETSQDRGKDERSKVELLDENLLQCTQDLRLGVKVHLPTGQRP